MDAISTIDGSTKLFGLLGSSIKNSYSPYIHNTLFSYFNINGVYIPLEISAQGNIDLQIEKAVNSCKTLNFVGFNVTMPYKTAIMKYIDYYDATVKTSGAVNTVIDRSGCLHGYNTDVYGFGQGLKQAGVEVQHSRCLIIGTGGAAKAVYQFLVSGGAASISIAGRNEDKAIQFISDLQSGGQLGIEFSHYEIKKLKSEIVSAFDLIINATPIGSIGYPSSYDSEDWIFSEKQVFYDLVYYPHETMLMKKAKEAGSKVISGLDMLIFQAIKSFQIWTGRTPPYRIISEAIENRVRQDKSNG